MLRQNAAEPPAGDDWLVAERRGSDLALRLPEEAEQGRRIVPRVSLAVVRGDEIVVQHRYPVPGAQGSSWAESLPWPEGTLEALGVLVEDLGTGLWQVLWLEP